MLRFIQKQQALFSVCDSLNKIAFVHVCSWFQKSNRENEICMSDTLYVCYI